MHQFVHQHEGTGDLVLSNLRSWNLAPDTLLPFLYWCYMCVGLSNLILVLFVLMCQHTHVDFVNCILISQTQQFAVMSVIIGITKTCISMSSAEFSGIHDVSWKCIKCTTLKSSSFLYQGYNITISNSYEPFAGTVKPVYNDHIMGYFSAFWSSFRGPLATQMSSRRQKLLARVNWYPPSSLKHITE